MDKIILAEHTTKPAATEPIGFPNISRFGIIDMFTACTTSDVKEITISSFTKPDGTLRIVVTTIAFGMELNFPNVRSIIHWGKKQEGLVGMVTLHMPPYILLREKSVVI